MTQANTELGEKLYFEDVLPETGWGLYYKFMIGMACACSFTQATTFLTIPYCIPLSTCERSLVTRDILLGLHTTFMLGRAVSGLLCNTLSDIYGRKRFLTYSLMIIFASTFTAAFAYNYYVIMIAAFFLASGLESNMCVVKVHLAEILPKNRRGLYIAMCDVFWTLGYVSLSLFAIMMKNPVLVERRAVDMRLTTWRMIFAISGGLNISLACATALLEESPRYFMHVKKTYLSLLTLRQFYAINKSSYGESFKVKEDDLKNIITDYDLSIYPESNRSMENLNKILHIMAKSLKLLFSTPFIKSTIVLLIIKTPLLILGPLDVNILLAKHVDVNSTVQEGIDVIYLDSLKNRSMCTDLEDSFNLVHIYFGLAACFLTGNIIAMLIVDCLGRRISASAGLILCGGCFIALAFIKFSTTRIILSSLLMVSLSTAITTITIINIEAYPTALRCTSWGVLNFLGFFTSIFVIRYYHLISNYVYISFGTLYCGILIHIVWDLLGSEKTRAYWQLLRILIDNPIFNPQHEKYMPRPYHIPTAAVLACLIDDLKKKPMIE